MNSDMKTSPAGLDFIARWEGCILKPYMDIAGLWTIGVGHLILPADSFSSITNEQVRSLLATKDKNHPVAKIEISKQEALDLLAKDVKKCEVGIEKNIKVSLNQNQFDALCSFGFNCGVGVYATSGACKALNEGKYDKVPELLLLWSKARINGTLQTSTGLLNRRKSEGQLFTKPVETLDQNASGLSEAEKAQVEGWISTSLWQSIDDATCELRGRASCEEESNS